jgi:hypothetical protein
MSLETMTKIATTTVGAGGVASVTFSNIPQNYTDLRISVSGRTTGGVGDSSELGTISFGFGSTSYTYSDRFIGGNGTAAYSSANSTVATSTPIYWVNGSGSTASTFASVNIDIPNYTLNNVKNFSYETAPEYNDTTLRMMLGGVSSTKTDPVTEIILTAGQTAFAQHSTFTLYGIKNARQTAGNSIKATGGNISFDGTYVVHTFPTSGTFTPSVPILAEYLVVAGGGGGGGSASQSTANGGGGGGAGGYRTSTLSVTPGLGYTVTIGAGGAAGSSSSTRGTSGSDSVFSTITSTGGGGGGASSTNQSGLSGGSGGGGGGGTGSAGSTSGGSGNTPSTSPSQGSNGGGNTNTATIAGSGGGGGSSATGSNPASTSGGAGGAGTANSIAGSSVTYAGGGGGGTYNNSSESAGAGGAGGGGAGGKTTSGTAGTANLGGGGGGANAPTSGSGTGGAGGSGIVVIRYRAVA